MFNKNIKKLNKIKIIRHHAKIFFKIDFVKYIGVIKIIEQLNEYFFKKVCRVKK